MFKKKKYNECNLDHIMSLTDGKDYGIIHPPMNAQTALNELRRYFLGENYGIYRDRKRHIKDNGFGASDSYLTGKDYPSAFWSIEEYKQYLLEEISRIDILNEYVSFIDTLDFHKYQ